MSVVDVITGVPPAVVYAVVAGVVAVESFGIPLPGETTLVTATLLSLHPEAHLWAPALAVAAAGGGAVGDNVGYWVGREYGDRLLRHAERRFPRHFSRARVARATEQMRRHGVYAVGFGRFMPLLRIMAGPLAGSLRMPYGRFLVANALGAALWAGAVVGLVVLVGPTAADWVTRAGWGGLAAVIALGGLAWVVHRRRAHLA